MCRRLVKSHCRLALQKPLTLLDDYCTRYRRGSDEPTLRFTCKAATFRSVAEGFESPNLRRAKRYSSKRLRWRGAKPINLPGIKLRILLTDSEDIRFERAAADWNARKSREARRWWFQIPLRFPCQIQEGAQHEP